MFIANVLPRTSKIKLGTGGFGHLRMIAHDSENDERWWRCVELPVTEVVPAISSE